ncbi:unnamed protein product [Prorocentrum cordatum]|uniref:Uncharacterized protein n=1 Tax=Prorocentrum cordatum TaxID=2364126 RepID=A0ABN9UY72_9DINO|nr:unnamed protein product [Polarella glacialis]
MLQTEAAGARAVAAVAARPGGTTQRAQWSERGTAQSLRLLASDRGSATRRALPPAVYSEVVAPFLRFDAAVPDQLYAVGGRNESQGPLDTVEMFETCGCAAAVLPDGRLMVSGGYDERGSVLGVLASSEVFDPVRQAWAPAGGQLQRPRFGHGSAVLSGKVYAVGGCALRSRSGAPPGDDVRETLRDCEVYDLGEQAWSSIPSLCVARGGARLVVLDAHRLAAVGGCDDVFGRPEMLASVEVYDTGSGTWTVLQEQLSVPRTTSAAAALDEHRIIIMGGAPSLSSVEIFDVAGAGKCGEAAAQPSSSSGGGDKELADMTEGRMGCMAVLMRLPEAGNDYPLCTRPSVVVVGGENGDDCDDDQETACQFNSVLVYDVEDNVWRSERPFPPMPTPRTAMALCVAPGLVRGFVS